MNPFMQVMAQLMQRADPGPIRPLPQRADPQSQIQGFMQILQNLMKLRQNGASNGQGSSQGGQTAPAPTPAPAPQQASTGPQRAYMTLYGRRFPGDA